MDNNDDDDDDEDLLLLLHPVIRRMHVDKAIQSTPIVRERPDEYAFATKTSDDDDDDELAVKTRVRLLIATDISIHAPVRFHKNAFIVADDDVC